MTVLTYEVTRQPFKIFRKLNLTFLKSPSLDIYSVTPLHISVAKNTYGRLYNYLTLSF